MSFPQQAVILCGGKGTRLGEAARKIPKPLVPVGGRPVLDHIIGLLTVAGVTDVILAAGHLGREIETYYKKHMHPCTISTEIESEPRGTAGALTLLRERLEEDFLLVYGDIFCDFDVRALMLEHACHRPVATLLVRQSDHPWDSDLICTDADLRVTEFVRQREPGRRYRNQSNAAVYVMSRDILRFIPPDRPTDFGGDVFPAALRAGAVLRVHALEPEGMVKDMGTPQRKQEVEKYLEERTLAAKARANRAAVDTVFLDRDGTLNRDCGYIVQPESLELQSGVAEAVARLNRASIKVLVITNQPVIARGLCTTETLEAIHTKLHAEIARAGGHIDGIYYCPHHPETHHGAGLAELRRGCECRKPAAGLLFRASREHSIDLGRVAMIGDRASDVRAGRRAGVRTVLVGDAVTRQREAGECAPDAEFSSLAEFVDALLAGKVFSS